MLKDSFGYNITDDGMLEVDVHSIIENNYNMSSLSFTLPTVNISEVAASTNTDLDAIDDLNVQINDPNSRFDGMSVRDLLDGDLVVTGANIMQAFEDANLTTIRIPIAGAIDALLNITEFFPEDLSHNFTLVDTFDAANGKFGETLGNVALVDCNYFNELFESSYRK